MFLEVCFSKIDRKGGGGFFNLRNAFQTLNLNIQCLVQLRVSISVQENDLAHIVR